MDGKTVVKVFKRKGVESSVHHTTERNSAEPLNNEIKAERRSRRELVNTISNWVTERRERSHTEEVEGLRRIFGDSVPTLSRA